MKSELIQNRAAILAETNIPANLTEMQKIVGSPDIIEDAEDAGPVVELTYKRAPNGLRTVGSLAASAYMKSDMASGMLSEHVETLADVLAFSSNSSFTAEFDKLVARIADSAAKNSKLPLVVDIAPSKAHSALFKKASDATESIERNQHVTLANVDVVFSTLNATYFVKEGVTEITPESFKNGEVTVLPKYASYAGYTSAKPMFELNTVFDHSASGSFSSEELNSSVFKKLLDIALPEEEGQETTTQETLKQIAGFGLLSKPKHDGVNAFFYSEHGGSGKSSILSQLMDVLPMNSVYELSDSDLQGDKHAFTANQLFGDCGRKVRVAKMDDLTDTFKIDGKLKSLMNGDKVAVRPIGGAVTCLDAKMTFMICSNKKLTVSKHAADDPLLRRMVIVPFKGKGNELRQALMEKHGLDFGTASKIANSEKDIKAAWLINGLLKVKNNLRTKTNVAGGVDRSEASIKAALDMIGE